MAIRPHFADSILAGRKRVEFRKRRFSRAVSHVIIYATEPVKRVIGMFEVKSVSDGPPARVWRR